MPAPFDHTHEVPSLPLSIIPMRCVRRNFILLTAIDKDQTVHVQSTYFFRQELLQDVVPQSSVPDIYMALFLLIYALVNHTMRQD
jgi:hypothetical protein